MIRRLHRIIDAEDALSLGELEPLLDEEAWAAPDRLSATTVLTTWAATGEARPRPMTRRTGNDV